MNTTASIDLTSPEPTRRKGNVARLPKPLRDIVNSMLDDGKSYPEIIAALEKSTDPKLPHPVTARNIGNWFTGGYQDYLRGLERRDRMTILADQFLDPAESDPIHLASGALHGTMIQICALMDTLSAKSDETDPKNFVHIANTLSRLSRSMIKISEYRAKLLAADPNSQQNRERARQELIEKMDELFGYAPIDRIDRVLGIENPSPEPPAPSHNHAVAETNTSEISNASENRNVKSEIPNVKSEIPNVKSEIPNVKSEISNVKSEIPNVKSEIPNVKSEISNVKSEIPSTDSTQPENASDATPLPPSNPSVPSQASAEENESDDDVVLNTKGKEVPWNRSEFSDDYLQQWTEHRRANKAAAQATVTTSQTVAHGLID